VTIRWLIALLLVETVPIICAVTAAALAYHGKPGWGWFLAVAVLGAFVSVREKTEKS
jgi:hypothetical protein